MLRGEIVEKVSVEALRTVGLFGALPDDALALISASTSPVAYAPGQVVFAEGEPATALYVVLSGDCEVLHRGRRNQAIRVASFTRHDWFGEMGLFDMRPRSATVVATVESVLLPLPSTVIKDLYRHDLKAYTLLVLNVTREVCRRLRAADERLADALAGDHAAATAPVTR